MNDGVISVFKNFLNDEVGYDLTLYDNDVRHEGDWEWERYTLTGQVFGFGDGSNYGAEDYLRSKLPHPLVEQIKFDSESGQFFIYSDEANPLWAAVAQFDSGMALAGTALMP